MDAGRFTESVTIQVRRSAERNKNGFGQETWVDYYKNKAYANNLYGSEYYSAAAVQAQETVKLTFRWKPVLNAVNPLDYRVIWNDKVYNIVNVDNVKYENRTVIIKVMPEPFEEEEHV